MDDVPLDAASLQPPRQPKPVAPRLKGEGNPFNRPARRHRLGPPAFQQPEQRHRIGLLLLQWLAIKTGNQSGYQPASLTQLNDHRQSGILIKGGEGTAQVTNLAHWGTSIRFHATTMLPCHP